MPAIAPEAPMPPEVAVAWDVLFAHYHLCEYGKRCALALVKTLSRLRKA